MNCEIPRSVFDGLYLVIRDTSQCGFTGTDGGQARALTLMVLLDTAYAVLLSRLHMSGEHP